MASVRRKPDTQFWFACFTDGMGIQRQRSTKTTNRKTALEFAQECENAYRSRQTEFQMRRVLSDIHKEIHGRPLEHTTLATYAATWLERKRGEVAPATIKSYEKTLKDFKSFAGPLASQPLLNISRTIVEAYRNRCAEKTTHRTANNKLKVLRTFLQSAWHDELISDNPAAKVRTLKTEPVIRRGFTMDELRKVMDAANAEWRGMVTVGFYIGPRLKDIALLTPRQVDMTNRILKFTTSKTQRFMSVPIADPLYRWLKKHLPKAPETPLFKSAHAIVTKTGDTAQLSQAFHDVMVRAGIAVARPSHRKHGDGRDGARRKSEITFHSLRHTITSALKIAGVPEAVTRDIVGHDSASVSAEYTHIPDQAKREALSKLPDIT